MTQPHISDDIVDSNTERINDFVQYHRVGPESLVQEFDKYIRLMNREEIYEVENFLEANPPHSLQEFGDAIRKYDDLSKSVLVEFYHTDFIGPFEIKKEELIKMLSQTALHCKEMLINRITSDCQQHSKR